MPDNLPMKGPSMPDNLPKDLSMQDKYIPVGDTAQAVSGDTEKFYVTGFTDVFATQLIFQYFSIDELAEVIRNR
jgi:hypothetical protein